MLGTTLLSVETREIDTGELILVAIERLQCDARCERWQRAFRGRHMLENNEIQSVLRK